MKPALRGSPLVMLERLGNTQTHTQTHTLWESETGCSRTRRITPNYKSRYLLMGFDRAISMNKHSPCFCVFSFKTPLPEVLSFHLLSIISQPLKRRFQPFHFTACPACFHRDRAAVWKEIAATVSLLPLFNLAVMGTHADEAFWAPSRSSRHVRGILPFIHFLMHSN